MQRKAASIQPTVGSPMARWGAEDGRSSRYGHSATGSVLSRLPGKGLVAIEVAPPPPGMKLAPKPRPSSASITSHDKRGALTKAMRTIGARATNRSKRTMRSLSGVERHRRAHRVGKGEDGLRAVLGDHLRHDRLEVAEVEREIVDVALARVLESRAPIRPVRANRTSTTVKPRWRSSPTVSKYFSMNSARPCIRHTVPCERYPVGSQRATRKALPSAVTTRMRTVWLGIGFWGVAKSSKRVVRPCGNGGAAPPGMLILAEFTERKVSFHSPQTTLRRQPLKTTTGSLCLGCAGPRAAHS